MSASVSSRRPYHSGGILRGVIVFAGVVLLVFGLLVLLHWSVFYSLYSWLFGRVVEVTGHDIWLSRAITLSLLAVFWYFSWDLLLVPWFRDKAKRVAILFGLTALALLRMEFATRGVFFSRADGSPAGHYVRTLDGYEFSASPGNHPVHGVAYRPVTPDVAREFLLWRKRGGNIEDPSVAEDEYYSAATGDPVRWYARLPDGGIEMFTLPGFHRKSGVQLLPVTSEVIAEYEKFNAEARAAREKRERASAPQPFRPGRYVFFKQPPTATIGDLCFRINEVHVTADHLLLHIEAEHLGVERFEAYSMAHRVEPVSFVERQVASPLPPLRFGLVRSDGEVLRPTGWRSVDGVASSEKDALVFPSSVAGRFVELFPPLEDRRMTFSPTINDRAVFGSVDLRKAEFRSF